MRSPWANSALLLISGLLLLSGFFGLLTGEDRRSWVLWVHGVSAYALLVLFAWKGSIILDALTRRNKWTLPRIAFLATLALLILTLLLGLAWTFFGPLYLGGFSLVSLHIYAAVPVLILIAWHSWRMKFIFRVRGALGRRWFLGTGFSAALGGLFWGAAGGGRRVYALPGAARRFTGSYEQGSFTGRFPAVSWIADRPAPIDPDGWRLVVDGAVARPLRLDLAAVTGRPAVEQTVLLDCTGGWYTSQVWTGLRLGDLLREAGVDPAARSLTIRGVTGYWRRFSLAEAETLMLAHTVAGRPLPHGHGAPLRLVAPGRRGFEWVKWVTHIEVGAAPALWEPPLPLR